MRTKLVNANFPATGPNSTDSYFAAFNIPDFFFFTLAAGALGVAFMPVLAEHLQKGDRKGMWDLSASLMNLLAIVMFGVAIVILLFAEPLIHHIVAPNLTGPQLRNAADIMRLLAFNPLLFTISGIIASSQQSLGRFFFYAIAPLFYNASIIASIFIFRHNLGLIGLGVGALIGAIIQLLIVSIGLFGLRFRWSPTIMWKNADFRLILRNLPPRSIDQGIDQIESIVETNFARRLGEGYVSYYNNAYTLQTAPVILIGTAISTAAFPRLTNRLAQNRTDLFRKEFLQVLRVMIWITLPVVVISYFCRGYLARLIFSRNSPEIALIFGFLCGAIFFRIIYSIVSRWFYAQKDTRTPLFVSIFAIALNVFLVMILARPLSRGGYGAAGLALAQSIVATVEVCILMTIMFWRDHNLFTADFWNGLVRILSVTGFTIITAYTMVALIPLSGSEKGFTTLGAKLLLIAIPTIIVHVGVSSIFGLEEAEPVIRKVRKVLFKPIRIQ